MCKGCGWVIKSSIRVILPAICRYSFKNNYIGIPYIEKKERSILSAIEFACPRCKHHFPRSETKRIKEIIQFNIILNKLK